MKTTTHLALLLAALAANAFGGDAKVTLDSANGSSAFIVRDSASNELARVQSDGKVGIGTTSPGYKLDVAGSLNATAVTINGTPVASSTDTYWSTAGSGAIQYSGGNVGIGTTTPSVKLDVIGEANFSENLTIAKNIKWNNAGYGIQLSVVNVGPKDALVSRNASGSPWVDVGSDAAWSGVTLAAGGGKVGIGTATPSQKLDVAGNIKITNQSGPVAAPDKIDLGTSYSNGATRDQCKIYLYDAGTTQRYGFGIGVSSDIQYHSQVAHDFYVDNSKRFSVTGSGGANSSDRRLKRDILPLNKYGLQQVMQLNPVTYIFKNDNANTPQVGFIAQEVQQIIPEVVTGKEGDLSKGESLGIVYGNLVPVLTKAIQELKAENDTLKAQNADILKRLDALEAKIK
jgi:hypothetical protein